MSDAKKKPSGVIGFLSKIGAVEVVDSGTAPVRNTPVPAAPRNTPIPSVPVAYVQQGSADPAVLERLEKRLQNNCPPAYGSFMEQYEALNGVVHDEGMRFQAALKTSHTTADTIVGALDQLMGAMETAHNDFLHDYEANKTRQLGEAEASIKATDDLIASTEAQMKSLQDTIVTLHTKRDTDMQSKREREAKIEQTKANFEAAHAQIVGRLQAQKNRILSMPRG